MVGHPWTDLDTVGTFLHVKWTPMDRPESLDSAWGQRVLSPTGRAARLPKLIYQAR